MDKVIKKILKLKGKGLVKYQSLWIILLIFISVIPVIMHLARSGYFYMQDDLQAFRIQQMHKCFVDFQIPCRWVPDAGYGYGYPQFLFYAPGVYYLGEVIHLLGFQYIDTVKILFAFGYILSALGMFVLVNSFLGKWPAFVASVLYTYVPYKAVEVYVRGAMSEFWAFVIFPLIFWAAYMYIKNEKRKYFLYLSLCVFALFLTHNLMPMIFLPFMFFWCLLWLWLEKKLHLFLKLSTSILLGFTLSAFFTLPLLFERKYVHSESLLGGYFDYRQHFVNLKNLFFSLRWGYGSSGFPDEVLNLSIGLPQWILGIVAFVLSIKNWKKNKPISAVGILLFILALFSLFMIHQRSSFIWNLLPILKWLQFPWRFLSVSVFLFSLLMGIVVCFSGKYAKILGVIVMISAVLLHLNYFKSKEWYYISDDDKFSGVSWEKQQTISIFDYTPIYAVLPPPSRAPDLPEVLEGNITFLSYKKGSNYQIGKVFSESGAVLRLPLFDFPGMKVLMDGRIVAHDNDNCSGQRYCLGLISFVVEPGEHIINVKLTNTPIRNIGEMVSLLSAFILFIYYVKSKENKISKG